MNPRVRDLLERDFRPTRPMEYPVEEDDETPPKTGHMPAFIVLMLISINGLASIGPMFSLVKPMEGNWQTMWQTLLVGGVAYFINSTAKSAQKDSTIATLSKGQK